MATNPWPLRRWMRIWKNACCRKFVSLLLATSSLDVNCKYNKNKVINKEKQSICMLDSNFNKFQYRALVFTENKNAEL